VVSRKDNARPNSKPEKITEHPERQEHTLEGIYLGLLIIIQYFVDISSIIETEFFPSKNPK
jgi:hypothetical protein